VVLNKVKRRSQNTPERFSPKLKDAIRITQQAFRLARQKAKREAFLELFMQAWGEVITKF
jgi:hypothetical protein